MFTKFTCAHVELTDVNSKFSSNLITALSERKMEQSGPKVYLSGAEW